MKHALIIAISMLLGASHAFAQVGAAGGAINLTPLSAEDLATQNTGTDAKFWTEVGTDIADQANPFSPGEQANTTVTTQHTGNGKRSTAGLIAGPLGGMAGGVVSR